MLPLQNFATWSTERGFLHGENGLGHENWSWKTNGFSFVKLILDRLNSFFHGRCIKEPSFGRFGELMFLVFPRQRARTVCRPECDGATYVQ